MNEHENRALNNDLTQETMVIKIFSQHLNCLNLKKNNKTFKQAMKESLLGHFIERWGQSQVLRRRETEACHCSSFFERKTP